MSWVPTDPRFLGVELPDIVGAFIRNWDLTVNITQQAQQCC